MTAFEDRFWNLAQAAAWVVYRDAGLINHFEGASRESYMAFTMYPMTEPKVPQNVGEINSLYKSLVGDRLKAWGYRADEPNRLTEIPSHEWQDLHLAPPLAYDAKNLSAQYQPWRDIRVESANVRKLWRSKHETSGRSKFDWDAIRIIHDDLHEHNPAFSQNELIVEIQGEFRDRFNKEPPSRSSIQRQLKS